MIIQMHSKENTRFDARLSQQQKDLLEKAAHLGGYRSLTDFVLSTAQAKASEIISEHERIIASKKDSEIFFNAILNPPEPTDRLKRASEDYKRSLPE